MFYIRRTFFGIVLCICAMNVHAGPPDWYFSDSSSGGSLTVLLIGLAHGIPVFLAGYFSQRRLVLILAAIIMTIIAFAIGNISYVFFDLLAIGVALYLGWIMVGELKLTNPKPLDISKSDNNTKTVQQKIETQPTKTKTKEDSSSWITSIVFITIIAVVLYSNINDKSEHTLPPAPIPQPQQQSKQQVSSPKHIALKRNTSFPSGKANHDMRHCLTLPTNPEIIRCANNVKN